MLSQKNCSILLQLNEQFLVSTPAKEVMLLLFLSAQQGNSKCCRQIPMKISEGVKYTASNKWSDFCSNPDTEFLREFFPLQFYEFS